MRARGVVFDLDETLIDRKGSLDTYARSLRADFAANSRLAEQSFVSVFHELDGNGRVPRPEFFSALSETVFIDVTPEAIATHFRSFAWLQPSLFDGVIDVIGKFKESSFAVGVVTNGGSHAQGSKLNNSGLEQHLDAYIISEEFGTKKPDPAIYAEIAHRLDIDPATSWFVGDDPISDVVGPWRFGFNAAWLERYLAWPEDYERCYAHRIGHISELCDALVNE